MCRFQRTLMDSHTPLEALSVSSPFLPLTAVLWVVFTDPAIKVLALLPPFAALLQLYLKPKARLKVESFKVNKLEKDGHRGFTVAAKISSKGRPIVSNVEVRLQSNDAIFEHSVNVSEIDGKRITKLENPRNITQGYQVPIATWNKLRQQDDFEFAYPRKEREIASGQSGKIEKHSFYDFLAYPDQKCKLRLVVQGDAPDGNTVDAKKEVDLHSLI